jgi:cytochrome c oxidase cbb3-type subunit 3
MKGFEKVLAADEIAAVVDFVRSEFMERKNPNTRYHTVDNGWDNHDKYRPAFPFALGQLSLATPWESLTAEQRVGRQIFVAGCITCHDRGRSSVEPLHWEARPLSFPRQGFSFSGAGSDTVSSATPYAVHDRAPRLSAPTALEQQGEKLFQQNCAFCHAADGSGKNWVGSFLESHPRDLRGSRVAAMSDAQLADVIRNGIAGTTMSAWRSVLTEPQIAAVVAYVRRAFVARAGASNFN